MSRKILVGLLAVGMVLTSIGSAGAISLFFDPSETNTDLGSQFMVDIGVSGLETEDLAAFRFDVIFDDAILDFDSYTLYDGLGDMAAFDADDYGDGYLGDGVVNIGELSLLSDFSFQEDSFTLATLTFSADAAGSSSLDFDNARLGDYWGEPLQFYVGMGSVTVVTPEPATYLLFGVGLLGVWGFRKKTAR